MFLCIQLLNWSQLQLAVVPWEVTMGKVEIVQAQETDQARGTGSSRSTLLILLMAGPKCPSHLLGTGNDRTLSTLDWERRASCPWQTLESWGYLSWDQMPVLVSSCHSLCSFLHFCTHLRASSSSSPTCFVVFFSFSSGVNQLLGPWLWVGKGFRKSEELECGGK